MSMRAVVRRSSSIVAVGGLVAACLVALAGGAPATTSTCSTTSWGGANGWDNLTINGNAAVVGAVPDAVLRVTPSAGGQSGSAFTTNAISLAQQASFSSHFTFQFTDPVASGADGLVFVVQTVSDTVGSSGGGIGYGGLNNSVGVELDDWANGEVNDPSDSHVGIDLNGSLVSDPVHDLFTDTPAVDLDDGQVRNVWVDYDGSTTTLEVRVSDSNTRPTDPLLTKTVDLSAVLGSTDAYVGFTSGTGAAWANHDVLTWDFSNCYAPNGVTDTTPPTANAGSDRSTVEGSGGAVALDGAVSDPDVGQTVTGTWSYAWDPSSPAATTLTATCEFVDGAHTVSNAIDCTDNGTVIATLTASDGTNTASDSATVTIANQAPSVSILSPDSVANSTTYEAGVNLPLSLNITDPGTNDEFTCTVDWGDGTVVGPTTLADCEAGHAYTAEGQYTVTVTIVDDDGGSGQDTAEVDVGPAVPSVQAGGPARGDEGSPIALDGTSSDPSAPTLWTYAWDASSPAASQTSTCHFALATAVDTTITCPDNGTVTATLTAGTGSDAVSDTTTVTIDNVAPTVTITAPDDAADGTSYDVGATVPLAFTVDDPGANDTFTCTVDWGDGTVIGPTTMSDCATGHAYATDDVYPVTVTITDDDGGVGSDSLDVDVAAPDVGGSAKAKVNGGGWLLTAGKVKFALDAVMDKKGRQHGHLELHTYDHHRFHGTTVTGLVVNAPTASWSGTGTWDHQNGYTYSVQVVDGGDGKLRTADHIQLSIYDPAGSRVVMQTGNLVGGNIKVHSKP